MASLSGDPHGTGVIAVFVGGAHEACSPEEAHLAGVTCRLDAVVESAGAAREKILLVGLHSFLQ
jgi:hypothetical protein